MPNEGWSTLKRIDLATSSFERFYVAVRQKPSVSAGSSCSLELLPVHIVGGWSCSISDYTPNVTSTIKWCEPVVAPPPAYLIVLTVLASCFVAALILFYTRYRSRRRAAQLMCVSADIQFRTSLSQKASGVGAPRQPTIVRIRHSRFGATVGRASRLAVQSPK